MLFIKFNELSIKKLFLRTAVVFLIKNNLTKVSNHKINTRFKINNIIGPKTIKTTTQSSHAYVGPYIFNSLPIEIRNEKLRN